MLPLAPSDRVALDLRWELLRTAMATAADAGRQWRKLNDELMAKWRAEGLDDLTISKVKAVNLALNDAFSLYGFFKGEVERYAADIQAELAYRTLISFGDDPTGLTYSRDDEPVATPVPPTVEGFSPTGRVRRGPNSSPAGSASDTRRERTHQFSDRPGSKQGEAAWRGTASPTLRGGAR